MVEFDKFLDKLSRSFPKTFTTKLANDFAFILGFKKEAKTIGVKHIYFFFLDYNNTGLIGQYKFSEFLKGFGPFSRCIENVENILSQP